MKLLDELANIIHRLEAEMDVRLTDEDFADGHQEIIHVFLHEACHAAVSNSVSWIHDLSDKQHTALDEILARLLENQMSILLGYSTHTPQEHIHELSMYPVKIKPKQWEYLSKQWKQRYGPKKDLGGMAKHVLDYLFPNT